MSNCCGSTWSELDKPPSKTNMGIVQIIELVIMGVVAILCLFDLFNMLKYGSGAWTVIAIIVDCLIIAGLIFIIIGLFCGTTTQKIRIGIYCFFAGTLIDIVCIVYFLINSPGSMDTWLVNLIKAIILIFLAWVLWRQSKNV